jgi:hypothetical protein
MFHDYPKLCPFLVSVLFDTPDINQYLCIIFVMQYIFSYAYYALFNLFLIIINLKYLGPVYRKRIKYLIRIKF